MAIERPVKEKIQKPQACLIRLRIGYKNGEGAPDPYIVWDELVKWSNENKDYEIQQAEIRIEKDDETSIENDFYQQY